MSHSGAQSLRHAILYCKVKQENKDFVQDTAKTLGVSESFFADMLFDALNGTAFGQEVLTEIKESLGHQASKRVMTKKR